MLAAALRVFEGDCNIVVGGRRLARRAPAVAPEFGVEDLVDWLEYKGLQDEPEHDAVFAALLAAAPRFFAFVDTPGHRVFDGMRAAASDGADAALVLVAADAGVWVG